MNTTRKSGVLVISLDLELHWGVRDRRRLDSAERERLQMARIAALRIARTLEDFSVHATWAVVGFLFARSHDHLRRYLPRARPQYANRELDPYSEETGHSESDDPFHFAPGLISAIADCCGQEIATHSFSHYYCCETGQSAAEFDADLSSAVAIGEDAGYSIQSYVFPRNQVNPDYLQIIRRAGILAYRGTQAAGIHAAGSFRFQQRPHRRLMRLCDAYIDLYGAQAVPWPSGEAPHCIGASRYLRSCQGLPRALEDMRFARIARSMESAAARGQLFHLWWHPEDFAPDYEADLLFLRRILSHYDRCRTRFGMRSLSMIEVAQQASFEPEPVPAVVKQAV